MNVGDIVAYDSPSPRYGVRWGVVLDVTTDYPHLHIGYIGGDHDWYERDNPRLRRVRDGDISLVESWRNTGAFPIDLETGRPYEP